MDGPPNLEQAFSAHSPRVYNFVRRMVRSPEAARDLSQETFLRAFQAAPKYRGDAPVEIWLLGIARNVVREWLRKHREVPFDTPTPDVAQVESSGPERIDVERALARMEPESREVLVLRFVLDLPGEEVARILGISHDAVRQRVVRAKAAFRAAWEA